MAVGTRAGKAIANDIGARITGGDNQNSGSHSDLHELQINSIPHDRSPALRLRLYERKFLARKDDLDGRAPSPALCGALYKSMSCLSRLKDFSHMQNLARPAVAGRAVAVGVAVQNGLR